MQTWHLTFSADGRNPLFPTRAAMFEAVRTLSRVAGAHMALFCIVDDHIHTAVLAEPLQVGRLARAIVLAMRRKASAGLSPAHIRHIDKRSYMEWVFSYILYQPAKHGLAGHPALWTGNCFLDLVGARRLVDLEPRLQMALPRVRLAHAFEVMELDPRRFSVPTPEQMPRYGMERLASAAGEAVCAELVGRRRTDRHVAARAAVVQLCREAGVKDRHIAERLEITRRGLQKTALRADTGALVCSVRRRLALEDLVAISPPHSCSQHRIKT